MFSNLTQVASTRRRKFLTPLKKVFASLTNAFPILGTSAAYGQKAIEK